MHGRFSLPLILALVITPSLNSQDKAPVHKGIIAFRHQGDQKAIPECYHLEEHQFPFEMERQKELPFTGVDVYHIRFPSPVESPHKENNTVHGEYYRPRGEGPFPGVIVLDITAGDLRVSRLLASSLAQNKIASLIVHMAYYGPRRPPGSGLKLLSTDFEHTLKAIRQTVLDLRRGGAWLASRPEIDAKRLGIMGTSLGSFMAALTAEMEPRFQNVVVLLGGGGFVDAYYDHPLAAPHRKFWERIGGTKAMIAQVLAPVEPLTCAANLKDRKLLIIAGKNDEIVPPKMAEALGEAAGNQRIIWLNAGHYSAILHLVPCLNHVVEHLNR